MNSDNENLQKKVKISVCLTTFNGEKYVICQLLSILSQLNEDDEVIISDDSSTDNTISLIHKLHDPRIKIFPNNHFRSPVYNFEFCLTKATGDAIFLSDQDDLWLPGKVMHIKKVFENNPDITLVASDARVIDGLDQTVADTFYPAGFKFTSSVLANIVRNHFLGCSLAMRRSMLPVVLPFPHHLPMHDSWLGIMNQLFGKVHFIPSPLIAFRKHDANFHPMSRTGIIRLLTWRWNLMKAVLGRSLVLFVRSFFARKPR